MSDQPNLHDLENDLSNALTLIASQRREIERLKKENCTHRDKAAREAIRVDAYPLIVEIYKSHLADAISLVEQAAENSTISTSEDSGPGCFFCDHEQHTEDCPAEQLLTRIEGSK